METKEYRTVDKSTWGPGPWADEPDKMQWQDEKTGLPCLIVRNSQGSGALCGYVGVPPGHRLHGKLYNDRIEGAPCGDSCGDDYHYQCRIDGAINVHGGITFSNACAAGMDESTHICHVAGPGEPDHVWWFGFDCSHAGDVSPRMNATLRDIRARNPDKFDSPLRQIMREVQPAIDDLAVGAFGETYKPIEYVKIEVRSLAEQLAALA